MPRKMTCPSCGRALQLDDSIVDRSLQCPVCRTVFQAPVEHDTPSLSDLVEHTVVTTENVTLEPRPGATSTSAGLDPFVENVAEDLTVPAGKLHPPWHVTLATFLGSPIAGGLLLALNFGRLGNPIGAVVAFFASCLGTAVLVAINWNLSFPGSMPGIIVSLVVMHVAAMFFQGASYLQHAQRGGETASGGSAVGLGVLCMVLFLAAVVGLAYLFEENLPKVVISPGKEVFYGKEATEGEARMVGKFLQEDGYFSGNNEASVLVEKERKQYTVTFVMLNPEQPSEEVLAYFRGLTPRLSQEVFNGDRVEIKLSDPEMNVKRTIR